VGQERPSGNQAAFFLARIFVPACEEASRYVAATFCVVSRAAARSIASPRRCWKGAIFAFMNARTSGGAVSGEPALNGRRGIVFESELDRLRGLPVGQAATPSVSAKIDAAVTPPR